MLVRSFIVVFIATSLASAGCRREDLQRVQEGFFKDVLAKLPPTNFKLAKGAKISSNSVIQRGLSTTAYANSTGYYKPFKIQVVDTESCNVASMTVINQSNGPNNAISILSTRLKIDNSNVVTEVEFLNAAKGSHMLFNPESLPDQAPAIYSAKQTAPVVERSKLIAAANSYCDGLAAGKASIVQAGPSCPRIENGVQTTSHCEQGLAMFQYPVLNRSWYADTETGVVMGNFYFDKAAKLGGNSGLWLNEYFKVENGKLAYIQAAMHTLPGKYVDVWEG